MSTAPKLTNTQVYESSASKITAPCKGSAARATITTGCVQPRIVPMEPPDGQACEKFAATWEGVIRGQLSPNDTRADVQIVVRLAQSNPRLADAAEGLESALTAGLWRIPGGVAPEEVLEAVGEMYQVCREEGFPAGILER